MYVCIYRHTYIHVHTYVNMRANILCMYVYMYVHCVYVCLSVCRCSSSIVTPSGMIRFHNVTAAGTHALERCLLTECYESRSHERVGNAMQATVWVSEWCSLCMVITLNCGDHIVELWWPHCNNRHMVMYSHCNIWWCCLYIQHLVCTWYKVHRYIHALVRFISEWYVSIDIRTLIHTLCYHG